MKKPNRFRAWTVPMLAASAAVFAIAITSATSAQVSSPSAACADLVSKVAALNASAAPSWYTVTSAVGAVTSYRTADTGIGSGLLMHSGTRTPTVLPGRGNTRFSMGMGEDRSFSRDALSGRAAILLRDRYDGLGFAIQPRTGALQWASYTWTPGVQNADITTCRVVGSSVAPASAFPGLTTAQRTIPIVEVNAVDDFPGYGSDSFRLLIKVEWSNLG